MATRVRAWERFRRAGAQRAASGSCRTLLRGVGKLIAIFLNFEIEVSPKRRKRVDDTVASMTTAAWPRAPGFQPKATDRISIESTIDSAV